MAQTSLREEVLSLSSRERKDHEESTHEDFVIVNRKLNLIFRGCGWENEAGSAADGSDRAILDSSPRV